MATVKEKKSGTGVITWQEQLEADAAIAAKQEESTSTSNFFGLKAGQLTWQGEPVKGNEMVCVILDSILENVYYAGSYDSEVPQAPQCYAFGRNGSMAPHAKVVEEGTAQHPTCDGCQWNEFGTAEKGKGKACRNSRRLAIIVAGTLLKGEYELFAEAHSFESAQIGFMKLPVTSVKAYAAYVKQLYGALKMPPHGVVTRISVVPDAKTQFRVEFEAYSAKLPDEVMGVIMGRRKEAMATIEFTYSKIDPEKEANAAPGKRGTSRPPVNRPAAAKRKY